uniref:Uncharacterized protein n=1 Tax=Anguilla anguilla TaxID=7936 RepID=A0A0E9VXM5_ANGAN
MTFPIYIQEMGHLEWAESSTFHLLSPLQLASRL